VYKDLSSKSRWSGVRVSREAIGLEGEPVYVVEGDFTRGAKRRDLKEAAVEMDRAVPTVIFPIAADDAIQAGRWVRPS
jgi:DNA-binding LacI/PurR family transcriptional regulator